MNPFFTRNYLSIFSLIVLMAFSTMVFATDGSKDNDKDHQKGKEQQQIETSANTEEVSPADQPPQSSEASEEESVSISSVSFNFVFYLIYKIKYADIFNIFSRKKEESSSSSFSTPQLNRLLERLTDPSL